jgi:hypothetical protein
VDLIACDTVAITSGDDFFDAGEDPKDSFSRSID